MRKTAIIVPCYNEEDRLNCQAFISFAALNENVHFIFVDDGSSDSTPGMIEGLTLSHPSKFMLISHEDNRGKAEAVRTGFSFAAYFGYDLIGFWDADLSTPLNTINRFAEILLDTDRLAVIGSRVKLLGHEIRRSICRHYLGRLFATAASLVSGIPIYDSQCGAKLFKNSVPFRQIFSQPFRTKWIFDLEILMRYLGESVRYDSENLYTIVYEYPLERWRDVPKSKLRWWDFLTASFDLVKLLVCYRLKKSKKLVQAI